MRLQIAMAFVVALPFLCLRATVIAFDAEVNAAILRVLLDVLDRHHVEPKQAMAMLGYDKSRWSRMCANQLPAPSITKLSSALTWPMLAEFIPEWSRLLAQHKLTAITESISLRRSA